MSKSAEVIAIQLHKGFDLMVKQLVIDDDVITLMMVAKIIHAIAENRRDYNQEFDNLVN